MQQPLLTPPYKPRAGRRRPFKELRPLALCCASFFHLHLWPLHSSRRLLWSTIRYFSFPPHAGITDQTKLRLIANATTTTQATPQGNANTTSTTSYHHLDQRATSPPKTTSGEPHTIDATSTAIRLPTTIQLPPIPPTCYDTNPTTLAQCSLQCIYQPQPYGT